MAINTKEIGKAVLFILGCELAGVIGSAFTFSALASWYPLLVKPFFNPPNWIFGPVWTILYALMGIAAYLIWSKGIGKGGVRFALSLFALQLALNVLWSALFFGLRSVLFGMMGAVALWVAVLIATIEFRNVSRWAMLIMLPYLIWVSFAMILSISLFMLN